MEKWQLILAIFGALTITIVSIRKIYVNVFKPSWVWIKKWDSIFREFVPDSGKSMKDQITNMEVMVGAIKSTQAALIKLDNLAVIECNGGGRCVMVNKSWKLLSGFSLDEALGWGWLNTVHADDRDKIHNEWISAISANSEFNSSYKMITKAHESFNVETICVINRNAKNEVVSIVGTVIRLQDDAPVKIDKA